MTMQLILLKNRHENILTTLKLLINPITSEYTFTCTYVCILANYLKVLDIFLLIVLFFIFLYTVCQQMYLLVFLCNHCRIKLHKVTL